MATEIKPAQAQHGDLVCDDENVLFVVDRFNQNGALWVKADDWLGNLSWAFHEVDVKGDYLFIFRPLKERLERFGYSPIGRKLRVFREDHATS